MSNPRRTAKRQSIERCATPAIGTFAVYETDRYPAGSALAGQERRVFRGAFHAIEDAKDAFPFAVPQGNLQRPGDCTRYDCGHPGHSEDRIDDRIATCEVTR